MQQERNAPNRDKHSEKYCYHGKRMGSKNRMPLLSLAMPKTIVHAAQS
jgi:hypothetical protein